VGKLANFWIVDDSEVIQMGIVRIIIVPGSRLVERDWAIRDVYLQRFAVTALPRQLQSSSGVPEFAEFNSSAPFHEKALVPSSAPRIR
jgi:hypothetical protein